MMKAIHCACAVVVIALGVASSQQALGQNRVNKKDFKLILQTSGEWSGNYTGNSIGFTDRTIILYQHFAGEVNLQGPEFMNMEAHLRKLRSAIREHVPTGYRGLVIMDYEAWPLSLYNVNWPHIRDPRIQRQLDLHPGWTYEQAERQAALEYLPYVQDFFLRSYETAKTMRPEATWGFYSLVNADRWEPANGYRRWVNNQSNWLWDKVDAICPYGYVGLYQMDSGHITVESLIADKSAEAVRLANSVKQRTGYRPYVFTYVNPRVVRWGLSTYEGLWLAQPQIDRIFEAAWAGGADGFILWQAVGDEPGRYTESEYIQILETRVKQAVVEIGFRQLL